MHYKVSKHAFRLKCHSGCGGTLVFKKTRATTCPKCGWEHWKEPCKSDPGRKEMDAIAAETAAILRKARRPR